MAIKTNVLASKNNLPIPCEFLQLYLYPVARLHQKPKIWNIFLFIYLYWSYLFIYFYLSPIMH